MELLLNFAWLALALTMVALWLRHSASARTERGMQVVAIVALLLILFPVISVTDDLATAQNPAETDTTIRRMHLADGSLAVYPAVALPTAAMLHIFFPEPGLIERIGDSEESLTAPVVFAHPVNRPPPAA